MVVNYLEIKATDILSLNHQEKTLQVFVQASFVIINVGMGSFCLFFVCFVVAELGKREDSIG